MPSALRQVTTSTANGTEGKVYYSGEYLTTDAALANDHLVAYYMDLPDNMGGVEWYVGKVLKISKCGVWADTEFEDGKCWVRILESERGLRWVALTQPERC